MQDINVVMSWLEGLTEDDWALYYSDSEVQNTAKAALELLENLEEVVWCGEPRLLTPDELRALPRCAIVWIEYFDGELQKSNEGIIAAFKCQDGKFVDEIMCYYVDFEKDMLPDPDGSCWRFWSAEPSAELRKETPWM